MSFVFVRFFSEILFICGTADRSGGFGGPAFRSPMYTQTGFIQRKLFLKLGVSLFYMALPCVFAMLNCHAQPSYHLYAAVISPIRSRNITYTQPYLVVLYLQITCPSNANDVSFKQRRAGVHARCTPPLLRSRHITYMRCRYITYA